MNGSKCPQTRQELVLRKSIGYDSRDRRLKDERYSRLHRKIHKEAKKKQSGRNFCTDKVASTKPCSIRRSFRRSSQDTSPGLSSFTHCKRRLKMYHTLSSLTFSQFQFRTEHISSAYRKGYKMNKGEQRMNPF
jgi:hypothetical protein